MRLSALMVILLIFLAVAYATTVDKTKPWHVLHQIARSNNDLTSIDEDSNGRIDAGIVEDTLYNITHNGAYTDVPITIDNTLTVGDIISVGSVVVGGDINVNGDANVGGTLTALSVKSSSAEISTLTVNGISTFNNNVNAKNIYTDTLCLRLSKSNSQHVCIDNWEDLLDVLYVRLAQ